MPSFSLQSEHIDAILSSPFQRCVETAHIISSERDTPLPINIEPGICEVLWDFPPGCLNIESLKSAFSLVNTASPDTQLMPESQLNWEASSAACRPRVDDWLSRLLHSNTGSTILVVSHGAPISHMIQSLNRDQCQSPLKVRNCGLTWFERHNETDGWNPRHIDCIEHLSDKSNLRSYL